MNLAERIKKTIGIKQVGFVDLDKIDSSTRPKKNPKEARIEETKRKEAEYADIIAQYKESYDKEEVRQLTEDKKALCEERDFYLEKVRLREACQSGKERPNVTGIVPGYMETVHYKCGPREGVALAYDSCRYIFATDLYEEKEDGIATIYDANDDGTFEGIFPSGTVLSQAAGYEIRMADFIRCQNFSDLDKDAIEEFISRNAESDKSHIAELDKMIKEKSSLLDVATSIKRKINELNAEVSSLQYERSSLRNAVTIHDGENVIPEKVEMPGLPVHEIYKHIPYLHGGKEMLTMEYPYLDDDTEYLRPWLRFRIMANVARLLERMQKANARTYVCDGGYFKEMYQRGNSCYKTKSIADVVDTCQSYSGALSFQHEGFSDTILYEVTNTSSLSLIFVYLRQDKLLFYESYSQQMVLGRPRIDTYMCRSLRETGTDMNRVFIWLQRIVTSHLFMEREMENTVNRLVDAGKAVREESAFQRSGDTAGAGGIEMRTLEYFKTLVFQQTLPDEGYKTYKWIGSGTNKEYKVISVH